MKTIFVTLHIGLAVLLSFPAKAQTNFPVNEAPEWVSAKGYWVVESNRQTPKESIIYFYNNENILVYKKEITGQKLKLNQKKVLLQLKTSLEDAVTAFENGTARNQQTTAQSKW